MERNLSNSLILNWTNLELIDVVKKYGLDIGPLLHYIKNNSYVITNKKGEEVDSYDCSYEELLNFLNSKQKLKERLTQKIYFDSIIICLDTLDNELIELLIKELNKKIIVYGIANDNINIQLLEKLISNRNCYCDYSKVVDCKLLHLFNKTNDIKFKNNNASLYLSDEKININAILADILEFIKKNSLKKIKIIMDINNPKIISDIMPYFEKKLDGIGIDFNIVYKLSKQSEEQMSKNYSHYMTNNSPDKEFHETVISSENKYFESVNDYITFNKIIDTIKMRIPKDASELDKVVYISTFVINYMSYYDDGMLKDVTNTIKNGLGVCQDYSMLTAYLLEKIGIKCKTVHGIGPTETNSHRWNLVYIDNKPYYLDNTWISNSNCLWLYNDCFLASLEEIKKSHGSYVFAEYDCKYSYPRDEIEASVERVKKYQNNYVIFKEQLVSLIGQEKYAEVDNALKGIKVERNLQEGRKK